jgi:hypothetical protein
MSTDLNNLYDPIWQEYFDNMENNFQSSNSQDIQNDLQLIIPNNNYGYGINSDANLYTEDDYSDSDSMPDLIFTSEDAPDDADIPHLDSWDVLWGGSVSSRKCNAKMP